MQPLSLIVEIEITLSSSLFINDDVSITFGLIVYHSLPIFADKFNDLNFRNGNFAACLWYTILSGIGLLSCVVTCFDQNK